MTTLDQQHVAELAGITARGLRDCHTRGTGPSRRPDGKYDCKTVAAWLRSRILEELDLTEDGEVLSLDRERARLAKAQADKTEREVKELDALLVSRMVVLTHWQALIGSMRSKLLAIPTKVAAAIAEPTRRAEIAAVIRAYVHEALTTIGEQPFSPEVQAKIIAHSKRLISEEAAAAEKRAAKAAR